MTSTESVSALVSRLFEARGDDLLRFLRRRLGSEVEARDISQEAYLRFIRLGVPERIANPEAYLFRIASNLLWEHKLRERNGRAQSPVEEAETVESTPFDLAISMQAGARLRSALDALPPLQRAVLVLHLRDEFTCGEIGRQAGISASMVKKHLSGAIAFCRRRLRDL